MGSAVAGGLGKKKGGNAAGKDVGRGCAALDGYGAVCGCLGVGECRGGQEGQSGEGSWLVSLFFFYFFFF